MHRIGVIVGSLRKDSINLKLAKALAKLGKDKFDFNFIELHDLPVYNEDLWANPPESVTRIKKEIEQSDAILFVSPEYNRSVSSVTKNVIDWGTRPSGNNSWKGKPAAMLGASPGAIGTAVAQSQLRSIVPSVGMILLGDSEIYLTYKDGMIDADYNFPDPKTATFLGGFLDKFDNWIKQVAKKAA